MARESHLVVVLAACLFIGACASEESEIPQVCGSDEAGPICLQEIGDEADFLNLAVSGLSGQGTKFMMPAREDPELLPLLFQNSQRWEYHLTFLQEAFPERYGDLDASGYLSLIQRRATRDYFAGWLLAIDDPELGRVYGYSVWTDLGDPAELLQQAEVAEIHARLEAAFFPRPFLYAPSDPQAVSRAQAWIEPGFPVYLGRDDVEVEVYTSGVAYGYVRRMDLAQLNAALREGWLSFRDIVVVDRVPFDVEAVVAGIVTGGRQWELSHVNVRMARRGTPNLFVKTALDAFAEWDGRLVRLDAERDYAGQLGRYRVAAAEEGEAETWWASHRPQVTDLTPPDYGELRLAALDELAWQDGAELCARYGGKTANLAQLMPLLPEEERVRAFGIPLAFLQRFLEDTLIQVPGSDPPRSLSLRDYIDELADDAELVLNPALRSQVLADLRQRIRGQGVVDPSLLQALRDKILQVFGDAEVKIRFRSSSNVEDALEFSGAGLYDSTSACLADDLDDDLDGPCLCDADLEEERTLERGLRRVWSSLFNDRAWAERDWYQVDQKLAGMGILVSQAFPDERANGVAFTGNPQVSSDRRYLVNVQLGDQAVVGNDARLVPERDFLRMADGEVQGIDRSRSSSLATAGQWILRDDQLEHLGRRMGRVARDFPLAIGSWSRDQVLLDMEFKVDATGQLRFKQIRPFLDKCRGVICNQAPADRCLDEQTLLHYSAWGECDTVTGDCRYEETEEICAEGCQEGVCL